MNSLKSEFVGFFLNQPETAESASKSIVDNLVEELILEHVFEIHRNVKLKIYEPENEELLSTDPTTDAIHSLNSPQFQKTVKCVCPICNQGRILPINFGPHLEVCMGIKRSSTRIASQRIAKAGKESSYKETLSDDDEDWSVSNEKPKASRKLDMKKKKPKNGRRPKPVVTKIQPINVDTVDDLASLLSLDSSSRTWDTETNSNLYLTSTPPINKKKSKSKHKSKASTP